MPRKPSRKQATENQYMEDEIVRAYQLYTRYELTVIAALWCGGDYEVSSRETRGALPIALTVAALLAANHPLLCRPADGQVMYSALGCAVECLAVMIEGRPISIPTTSPKPPEVVHSPCVQPGYKSELYTGSAVKSGEGGSAR